MAVETTTIAGIVYVTHDCLCVGDYGGAGDVGRANINTLLDEFKDSIEQAGYRELDWAAEGSDEPILHIVRETPPKLILVSGSWGSERVYLREDVSTDIIASLSDYPLLDEQENSRVLLEWENEAWKSWLRDDLLRTLPDNFDEVDPTVREQADELPDETLFELYRQAMEETNTYPTPEYSGVYVRVDDIKDRFGELVLEALAA